jgi:exosortase A-associated hydrolase 2
MQEEYRYLELDGERLFIGHHAAGAACPTRGVVLCHPLGEEKLWSHRVFVSLARELAAAGIAALRFDFRGEGDSDRDFEQSDFESRVADTNHAIEAMHALDPSVTEVSLVGLRLGAAVAAEAAARRNDVSGLILWDPVTDGAAYMQAVLRLNLMFQMTLHRKVVENRDALVARLVQGGTVNIEGYELAEPLFRQVSAFRLDSALARFSGDALLVQVNQGEAPLKPELAAASESHPNCKTEAVQEEPFWKEIKAFYQRAPELTRVTFRALGVGA